MAGERAEEGIETRLRAEQEAGVAAVAANAEAQKRKLQSELAQTGATAEEKEVLSWR